MNRVRQSYGQIKQLAQQLGLISALDRIGWRRPLSNGLRMIKDWPRWRLINEDYRACQAQFRQIAEGAPAGNPNKVALMISSWPTIQGLKLEGVLSLALRRQGFSPKLVELNPNSWNRPYHALFGNREFLEFQKILALQPPVEPTAEILAFKHSHPTVRGLIGLTYHQVDIGRIALSNVIYRHKFAPFDLTQPKLQAEVVDELLKVQRNVLAAEQLLNQARPVIALLLEKGLSPAAELFGVCLAEGIPVVQYVNSQDKNSFALKRFMQENRHQHPFSLDVTTWKQVKTMSWSSVYEDQVMHDLAESYKLGTWFNRKFLHQGKRIKAAEEVRQQLGLDPSKKTAVIFSHVLWDATFFYGESLFEDYETWLLEAVRAACANSAVNWIVKLHPDLVWKLKSANYTGELRDLIAMRDAVGALPEHVKLVMPNTDISTYSFFEITDYCLTVRGTIGIEMACHGVPVLTAGTGRYSQMGFTIDFATPEEYLQSLASIQNIPPMPREQIELARRFAYTLFKLRPWKMHNFEIVRMPIEQTGHPLDHNLVAHVDNFAEFSAAPDMREFAEWVASDQVDYLSTSLVGKQRDLVPSIPTAPTAVELDANSRKTVGQ